MVGTTRDWEAELRGWLGPFLERLGHKARQRMCPLYISGLIGPRATRYSIGTLVRLAAELFILRQTRLLLSSLPAQNPLQRPPVHIEPACRL
jgi:hypothetical protein